MIIAVRTKTLKSITILVARPNLVTKPIKASGWSHLLTLSLLCSIFKTSELYEPLLDYLFHRYRHSLYLFQINNGNTRTMCEICSNLTIMTPEQCHALLWCFHGWILKFKFSLLVETILETAFLMRARKYFQELLTVMRKVTLNPLHNSLSSFTGPRKPQANTGVICMDIS